MYRIKPYLAPALLLLLLAACAPQARAPAGGLDDHDAVAVNRVATAAWHRMEVTFLETGGYTTNALVDLQLPQGTQWMLADFTGDDYRLNFVSTQVPELLWVVSPDGVTVRRR